MPFEFTMWEAMGALGIWLIELSYFPQIARLFRRKEADDISLLFPGLNFMGRVLAAFYAFHMGVTVLGFGFVVGCFLRATLLGQVSYYRWVRGRWIRPPGGVPIAAFTIAIAPDQK